MLLLQTIGGVSIKRSYKAMQIRDEPWTVLESIYPTAWTTNKDTNSSHRWDTNAKVGQVDPSRGRSPLVSLPASTRYYRASALAAVTLPFKLLKLSFRVQRRVQWRGGTESSRFLPFVVTSWPDRAERAGLQRPPRQVMSMVISVGSLYEIRIENLRYFKFVYEQ